MTKLDKKNPKMLLATERPAVDVSPLPWKRLSKVAMPSPNSTDAPHPTTIMGNTIPVAALPRYCNYSKDGFGNKITVIKPLFFEEGDGEWNCWLES